MLNKNRNPDKGLVYFNSRISLDGSKAGQVEEKSDEDLAAEQRITVEQLKEAQAKILARVYALILSWPDPLETNTPANDEPRELSGNLD